jgi:epoxide hydrolase-like predicted phosphatase
MVYRAIIFDFGGVIVRTISQEGRIKWEKRLGLDKGQLSKLVFNSDTANLATLGKVPESKVWENLGNRLNLDQVDLMQLQDDFWAGDRLDNQLVDFLSSLRSEYKTAILSNAWTGARQAFYGNFHLGDKVETMIISSEEGIAKPDPKIYHLAVERLGVSENEAIFVDDFMVNVEAANSVGMKGLQFINTEQIIKDIHTLLD